MHPRSTLSGPKIDKILLVAVAEATEKHSGAPKIKDIMADRRSFRESQLGPATRRLRKKELLTLSGRGLFKEKLVTLTESGRNLLNTISEVADGGIKSADDWDRAYEMAFPDDLDRSGASAIHVRSEAWTGPRYVMIDVAVLERVQGAASLLDFEIRALSLEISNSEIADLLGLAQALCAIVDMADPDISLIDKITSHPKFRGYASLVVILATIRGALGI